MAVGLVVPLEPVITWKSTSKAAPQIAAESGMKLSVVACPRIHTDFYVLMVGASSLYAAFG